MKDPLKNVATGSQNLMIALYPLPAEGIRYTGTNKLCYNVELHSQINIIIYFYCIIIIYMISHP